MHSYLSRRLFLKLALASLVTACAPRRAGPSPGEEVAQPEAVGRLPVSPEHLSVICSALEGVVSEPRSTARPAFEGASFSAAGKTGTAETGQEQPSQAAAPAFRQVAEAYLTAG
jgi:cell division protein FtsI/penicillin-binding protein 2